MSRTVKIVSPSTEEVIREFPGLTDEEAAETLDRAHEAYLSWRETPLAERIRLFRRLSELMVERKDELVASAASELGSPLGGVALEADLATGIVDYYVQNAERLLEEQEITIPGTARAVVRHEPVGVVFGVAPWNGPIYQPLRPAVPNIMLGNTAIVKPAAQAAGTAVLLEELFLEAGFPQHVYTTALVSHEQSAGYIRDRRVRGVTFTGSERTGRAIGALASENITPVSLELGASDAFLVLDSADVAVAAATAAGARLFVTGQTCVSPKRAIVTEKVADEFIKGYSAAFEGAVLGDATNPAATTGPLISRSALEEVQAQLDDAIAKGATVLVEGGTVEGTGFYFKPAVITDITPEMRVYSEEVFGPIGMVYRVPDAAAAVELANSSSYGLGGTVFASDPDEAQWAASRLDTGAVGINTFLGPPAEIPFGGTKNSGVGRELGPTGMAQFANVKTYGIAG